MQMNSPGDLIHDVGIDIADILQLPHRFGEVVKRVSHNDGFIWMDSEGRKVEPNNTTPLSGWHYIESAQPVDDPRSLDNQYILTVTFVCFGATDNEGAEWLISKILRNVGELQAMTTDLPQVLANHFPYLLERIAPAQPNLFGAEFRYRIRYSRTVKKKVDDTLLAATRIHDSAHALTHV